MLTYTWMCKQRHTDTLFPLQKQSMKENEKEDEEEEEEKEGKVEADPKFCLFPF